MTEKQTKKESLEDYFDDFGETMPEEVKMQNMYLVGKDLYDCFNRMVLEEE